MYKNLKEEVIFEEDNLRIQHYRWRPHRRWHDTILAVKNTGTQEKKIEETKKCGQEVDESSVCM